ncbi:proprotein convertase subtilisin/kexin type 4-like [Mercenaria mercenaria]|uniref:proprotein convertase subtilisin/kexin type 4-like n=1 Tax=Mercenaria mercenaria TaxID=6596 RepID=UPI00234EA853|nr:proprotein convertase subtilisin/kexin type 4-like [Mercenaria mercenaria]
MGIEDAWSRGFTGKGVVVAVTDVGINTDLIDIQPNIDDELCFNFVNNSTDVTPEYFHSYKDTSTTDHGNRCASLIAAVKGNNVCSAGIAFNSSIVALKIFGVYKDIPNHIYVRSSSDMMARSHVYELQSIDIYSNSWGPSQPFSQINLDQREAIDTSAKKGRRGLGAVHVFPVGPTGNELANNEHTITVSAVGQHGTVPRDSVISASVLTSGLLSGNNLTADSMMTTSFGNKCITSFAGVSAAAAQVAGMIALALEIKPLLTLADVQDLIVYSSDLSCLKMSENVSTNAAGLKFHPVFGFGLLNGTKLVDRANEMKEGLEISEQSLSQITACDNKTHGYIADFCYNCNPNTGDFILTTGCLYAVKTAKIQFMYRTSARQMRISLISPNGTVSILQDLSSDSLQTGSTGRKQILTSVHFWDEDASGLWRFKLQSDGQVDVIGNVSLSLFGVVSDITTNGTSIKETDCAMTCSGHVLDSGNSDSHDVVSAGVIVAVVAVAAVFAIITVAVICIRSKHRSSQSGVPMIENGQTSAESQSPLMNQRVNSETLEETAT